MKRSVGGVNKHFRVVGKRLLVQEMILCRNTNINTVVNVCRKVEVPFVITAPLYAAITIIVGIRRFIAIDVTLAVERGVDELRVISQVGEGRRQFSVFPIP